jgi:ubiquinone/menaquinone biosynthesis C-methylase UbiE
VDFVPDFPASTGLAQRFMESERVVSVYEAFFRPAFTSLGSSIKYHEEERWLKAIKPQRPIRHVLDLAAGTGRYARLMADVYRPDIVFAADVSEPMIRQGVEACRRGGYNNVLYLRADAHHLPFVDGGIDRANCFGALHLFPDPQAAIRELGRVSAERAAFTCLAACEHPSAGMRRLQAAFARAASFRFFTVSELNAMLGAAGLSELRAFQKGMLLMFEAEKGDTPP